MWDGAIRYRNVDPVNFRIRLGCPNVNGLTHNRRGRYAAIGLEYRTRRRAGHEEVDEQGRRLLVLAGVVDTQILAHLDDV